MARHETDPPPDATTLTEYQGTQIYVGRDGKFGAIINQKWVWLASLSSLKKRITGYVAALPVLMISHAGNVHPPRVAELIEITRDGHARVRFASGTTTLINRYGERPVFADEEARATLIEKATIIADLHRDYNATITDYLNAGKIRNVTAHTIAAERAALAGAPSVTETEQDAGSGGE